ncbi:hypothetical protein [Enterococcus casseliflavus]|uniref:hypothetical protein n=1 Tax=Enterococcus casseliflavus TaxID=37734 RepID=UPI001A974365|nr:hypothetical protein [Enterococcus casseliflavus]MBO1122353.1 hypothetical protein [Enterococcus casseliflavus]MDB1688361.1 hypothetical protein [Enterococcus casseliflavus]
MFGGAKISLVEEAKKRLDIFSIEGFVKEGFREGEIYCSKRTAIMVNRKKMILPAIFSITDQQKKIIEKYEKRFGFMVFHVIETNTKHGLLLTLLHVSQHEFEWEQDRKELEEDKVMLCFTVNIDFEDYSEFTWCCFNEVGGGLLLQG